MHPDYDFNLSVDRRGTGSYKWRKTEQEDVIPFGVADMDFRSPPEVLRALHDRVDHGIFGYSIPTDALVQTVKECSWMNTVGRFRRTGWYGCPGWYPRSTLLAGRSAGLAKRRSWPHRYIRHFWRRRRT